MEIESHVETSDIVKIWTSNRKSVGYWEEHAPVDWKRIFYEDQQTNREYRLSEEIDIEHTNEMEQIQLHANEG